MDHAGQSDASQTPLDPPEGSALWTDRDEHVLRPGSMPPFYGQTDTLLIVDDDPVVASVLAELLAGEGYRCSIAANAAEARTVASKVSFAVALVDVLMPGDSGLELVAWLVDVQPDISVVMVTAVDDPDIAEIAARAGASGYVLKPFTETQVVIAVSNASHLRCRRIETRLHVERLERRVTEQAADLDDALDRLKREQARPPSD